MEEEAVDEEDDRERYIQESVRIEPLALNEEFVRLPADLARWNHLYAEAVRAHLMAKLDLDRATARARIEHRIKLLATTAKPTESMVEATVDQDDVVNDFKVAAIEAEVEKVRLHGVLDAVRTKRDMLISLGAHVRAEMQGDPQIREEARGSRLARQER